MEQASVLASPLIPIFIMTIPIVIFNMVLSKRKGRNIILYGFLSFMPLVGFYLALYLASLTDKSVNEKIDKLISMLESR